MTYEQQRFNFFKGFSRIAKDLPEGIYQSDDKQFRVEISLDAEHYSRVSRDSGRIQISPQMKDMHPDFILLLLLWCCCKFENKLEPDYVSDNCAFELIKKYSSDYNKKEIVKGMIKMLKTSKVTTNNERVKNLKTWI